MADLTSNDKVDGVSRITSEEWNEAITAINTKYDSSDVGTAPGKLVVVQSNGLIDPSLYVAGSGGGGGGSGTMTGPGSTTAGRPVLWDSTDGTLTKQGNVNQLVDEDGTDGQIYTMNGTDPEWMDNPLPDPSGGTDGQVVTISGGAYTLASSSLEADISAIVTEYTDLTDPTIVPALQGGVLGYVDLGANSASLDPNSVVITDALGNIDTTGYATFADAIGFGTGDTVQFGAIELGDATANTLTASSGDLSIEGQRIFRVGGTDVPVADGGTGASTASGAATNLGLGTGDSPQFTAVNIGHASDTTVSRASAGVIAVEGVNLTPNIPQTAKSAAYTLTLADANTHLFHPAADTTGRTWTIPANASVAFPIGTWVSFIAEGSSGTITIAITSDTLVLAGTGSTGSRTLAAHGWATAIKVTSTKWYINGVGLT